MLSLGWACMGLSCARGRSGSNPVVGVITPEYFRFRQTVADNDPRQPGGGWRAVCIHAQLNQGTSGAKTVCKFEVGLPLRTEDQGVITLEEAQFAAAAMANRAVRDVMGRAHPGEMLFTLCEDFKTIYEAMLNTKYASSRVGACLSAGIETVPFGIELGEEPGP
ncbi:MAG TPA: hypothetical protein VK539_08390 [Myxococcaceae bacterium]|nr:hypothetical protein [Myxococcaceae bacterium]